MNTHTFKLSSGEELIARLQKVTDSGYVVSKPVVITLNPNNGQPIVLPWIISVTHSKQLNLELNKFTVITHYATDEQIANMYLESTSGLIAANSSLI